MPTGAQPKPVVNQIVAQQIRESADLTWRAPEAPMNRAEMRDSTNTKIRLVTRVAFGFKSPEPLTALAMLSLSGHQPALPGRK